MVRLVVGVDLEPAVAVFDGALGAVGVGRGERGAHVFEPDPVFEQRKRIELDAHRRQRTAADRHLADAVDLRQRLLHDRRGGIVDLAARQRGRGHRQDRDRRIGRIDLAVGRVGAQTGRQVGTRCVDRRLNVARGAVDIPVETELQRDPGRADRALRGHFGDVGNDAEMAFERCRHGRRHRVRARPRHRRKHRDRRKIDLRQRRDRQLQISEKPGERDADGQQRGRDRPLDERRRRVHRLVPSVRPPRRHEPAAQRPAQPVEAEINDRCREQGQQLAENQTADDRHPERVAQLRAGSAAEHQRQCGKKRRHRRHQDRPETQQAGLIDRLARQLSLVPLGVEREVDHHDRILFDDADQQDDPDDRNDAEIAAVDHQRQQRSDTGRRQVSRGS